MANQVMNPYLPLDTYIPDGEPHVFGDRVYVFGSHNAENGTEFCVLDYEAFSTPVDDLTAWRSEGVIYRADQDPGRDEKNKYMYAPDVVQGNDGRYYLYYAMSGGHFTGPIHVAVCDTPANLPDSSNMPYIGCKNGERCIYDICEDTVIGYKYFDLSPAKALVLRVRGSGSFTVRAGRVVLGQITLPGGKGWQTVRLPFTAQGVHALYLAYSGEGCCDMDESCFE